MLSAMRTLALDYLFQELGEGDPPENLDGWYHELRRGSPERLFKFLVEDVGQIERVFVIEKDRETGYSELQPFDMTSDILPYLPFNPGRKWPYRPPPSRQNGSYRPGKPLFD